MKNLPLLKLVALSLVLCAGAVGCKKTPKNVTTIPGSNPASAPGGGNPAGTPVRPATNPNTNPNGGPGNVPGGKQVPDGADTGSKSLPQDSTAANPSNPNASQPIIDTKDGVPVGDRPGDNMAEDRAALQAETVYFQFDRAAVEKTEASKVEAAATFLKNDSKAQLRIEGNCDERGTEEYNRSLGERRALAIREYLITLGIAPERVTTVSYGEDKAADPGHDETAWAKNRRGEFVVLRPRQ